MQVSPRHTCGLAVECGAAENEAVYLRPYQSADLDALYALDTLCFAAPFRFSRATMRQVATRPRAVVRLACETALDGSEHLLGFCAVSLRSTGKQLAGYVDTLDVAPEARGRGLGEMLMTACEQETREAGGRAVLLHVYVENAPALRLYERLGYARLRREPEFYGPGLDAWFCAKAFTGTGSSTR